VGSLLELLWKGARKKRSWKEEMQRKKETGLRAKNGLRAFHQSPGKGEPGRKLRVRGRPRESKQRVKEGPAAGSSCSVLATSKTGELGKVTIQRRGCTLPKASTKQDRGGGPSY